MIVAVYAIALDEVNHVDRFMSTAREADAVVVADTGSTDGTQAALRAAGAIVHQIYIRPWRFDDARNASLALVGSDVDVCVAIDLDEVLSPGWRRRLEQEWGDATRARYLYTWSHRPDGSAGLTYWYDRIHQRHGYRWRHPCHETLYPDRIDEHFVDLSLELHHWPDPTKSRSQYLDLLALATAEQPDDSRMSHYYGRELMFGRQWSAAAAELQRHLQLPQAIWHPERAASMRFIARCMAHEHHTDEAVAWARAACDEAPELREVWTELAQICHDQGRWQECFDASARAMSIDERPAVYLNEDWAWGERAADLGSVAAWHLGKRTQALALALEAAALAPDDQRIAANVAFYRSSINAEA